MVAVFVHSYTTEQLEYVDICGQMHECIHEVVQKAVVLV